MSLENSKLACIFCDGKGCPECPGYGNMSGISDDDYWGGDEPYCDDNDDEDWQGDSYANYPVDVRPTLRGRIFTLRWFTIPEFFASLKWKFWYARWRMKHKINRIFKHKINRIFNREEYDEIPF